MEPSAAVIDVDQDSFEREVVERSLQTPVVVDFWAPWCGPCRFLGPVLEQLVEGDYRGRLVLAKVNSDDNPELAVRFAIRGIPAVKFFRHGRVVAEFVGALPEPEVRRYFDAVLPSAADRLAAEADERLAAGDRDAARSGYRAALEEDRLHPAALLGLGRLLEEDGAGDEALDLYRRVTGDGPDEAEATRRAALLELRLEAGAGDPAAWRDRIAANSRDAEARYQLGLHLAARGEWRPALEELLAVVRIDRSLGDDGGRKAMLRVFDVIGPRSDLAEEFRGKLASAIY
jgi:putative thioredoxin